ncbi:MAG: 4-alpha-glucanotransferase, partial [Candidatus Rokubacteria bacterium]|nr:4-alpha-glucanotransferase [Candidatus Rokubacteria bacterium]
MVSTDLWGVVDRFEDAQGVWRETSESTRAAVLAAMGGEPGAPPPGPPRVRVVRPGRRVRLAGPAELALEAGAVRRVDDRLPPDLPLGYHELRPLDGGPSTRLIVSPGRCPLSPGLAAWGWAVQLYATRSRASWGIGDLADLRRLGRWSRGKPGAGLLLVNPLNAATPVTPLQPSPYCPTSRRFRHPIYLRIEEVPGAGDAGLDLPALAARGRALNAERRIDRDAVWRLKLTALERLWSRFAGDPGFDRYCAEQGEPLAGFATFCALAERHSRDWRAWPVEVRRPDVAGVARFRAAEAARVRFHQWLQWLVDAQLARASAEIPVMHDLPIGVDPGGADAWAWQDVLALDATVGAPPDLYNTRGQDWGLPPFVPHRLAAVGYEPFVQTIRANLRHAGGLRIDHVMGLFRLYWIPRGMSPTEGAYVRYPADDLLAILALESHRAGAVVVGEDLGTVEDGVRRRLRAHRVLSYRLVW